MRSSIPHHNYCAAAVPCHSIAAANLPYTLTFHITTRYASYLPYTLHTSLSLSRSLDSRSTDRSEQFGASFLFRARAPKEINFREANSFLFANVFICVRYFWSNYIIKLFSSSWKVFLLRRFFFSFSTFVCACCFFFHFIFSFSVILFFVWILCVFGQDTRTHGPTSLITRQRRVTNFVQHFSSLRSFPPPLRCHLRHHYYYY